MLQKRGYDHDPKTMHWQGAGRTATADAGSCTSPNSPRRRSPRRSACTAPSFPAICNRPATYAAAGIPPILRWRALLRWLSGNGDRHPTRCMRLRPGTLHPGASPHFRSAIASRGGGRILERKEDLRPAGRWIRPPTEVVNSICNLTQFNAILRNFTQMPAISRKFTKTNANSRKFLQDRGIAVSDCASHCVNWTYIAGYAHSSGMVQFIDRWGNNRRLPCRERTLWRSGLSGTPRSAFPTEFGRGSVTQV